MLSLKEESEIYFLNQNRTQIKWKKFQILILEQAKQSSWRALHFLCTLLDIPSVVYLILVRENLNINIQLEKHNGFGLIFLNILYLVC